MGRYYKNRRRCNFSKKKLIIYTYIILVIVYVYNYLGYLDKKLNNTLNNFIDEEVERVFINIVNRVLRENNVKFNDYLIYNIDDDKYNISYDIDKVNEYTDFISYKINEELIKLENEEFNNRDDYRIYDKNKYKYIRSGLLYEFKVNNFNNILFSNIGLDIPIKITYLGSVNSNIKINCRDYGINNVIIEAYLNINVKSYSTKPVGSLVHNVSISELVFVDIINGVVPNYYINGGN